MKEDFTLLPTENWIKMSPSDRLLSVKNFIKEDPLYQGIKVEQASENGHVVFRVEHSIAANERGVFLLDLEEKLKHSIDEGITVWLEPVGDKSKLRQLRGVEVKS